MAPLPLLEELSKTAMSTLTKDQLLILIQREVKEDASKVSEFKKLAGELLEDIKRRRSYIGELKNLKTNKDAIGMVELLQRMQKDDMEKALRLLLMANETKLKMHDKNNFILKIKGLLMGSYVNEAMCDGYLLILYVLGFKYLVVNMVSHATWDYPDLSIASGSAGVFGRSCICIMVLVINVACNAVWEIQGGTSSSTGWKNLLGLRDSIKQHVIVRIGDGKWKTSDGVVTNFSVNKVWKELKKNEEQVDWYRSVWFSHCIPSHAFILWLAILGRLSTQDRLVNYNCISFSLAMLMIS
ncbi:reverse transcriptase domain, reverse transcriptase zinc-binding domain protein [Tanacetum coccineum]